MSKLYTEEQVMKAYNTGIQDEYNGMYKEDIVALKLTPIELPSDEEIEKILQPYSDEYAAGYYGAINMIEEKILGKEDKTFKQKSKWTKVDNATRRLKQNKYLTKTNKYDL